jgi:hypothetical protein
MSFTFLATHLNSESNCNIYMDTVQNSSDPVALNYSMQYNLRVTVIYKIQKNAYSKGCLYPKMIEIHNLHAFLHTTK